MCSGKLTVNSNNVTKFFKNLRGVFTSTITLNRPDLLVGLIFNMTFEIFEFLKGLTLCWKKVDPSFMRLVVYKI